MSLAIACSMQSEQSKFNFEALGVAVPHTVSPTLDFRTSLPENP